MGIIIIFISLLFTIFASSQIFGCLFFKVFKKGGTKFWISIIIWSIFLLLYYLAITNWLNNYFAYYLYSSIAGIVISLLFIRNEWKENLWKKAIKNTIQYC